MDFGFIIGNGESRKGFDLDLLKPHGAVWGCNAIYRDYKNLDMLVALDHGVLVELKENYKGTVAKFSKNRRNALVGDRIMDWRVPHGAWYSGIAACWMFCMANPEVKRIFLLGFDFYDSKTNNLYKDSLNYETMGINNKLQFDSFKKFVFSTFLDKNFYRVGNVEDEFPENWKALTNIDFVGYDWFKELLE